ncbi:MAG: hypothetical protein IKQ43_12025 [Treponema sp.]|nr:hypothetical protein [Treponema sp.]
MEQEELSKLLQKLSNSDMTQEYEKKLKSWESQFNLADEKGREILRTEFNKLEKEICEEIEKEGSCI